MYLRRCAERSRHVLHAHAGRTAFQRAANVCHAAYQGIVGLNLVGRTGKHSAVHVRHTRYHNLVQSLVVWRQRDFHCGLGAKRLGAHADVTCNNFLAFGHREGEVTVLVCHGTCFRTLHNDGRSNDGFVVFRRDNCSGNLCLRHRYPCA